MPDKYHNPDEGNRRYQREMAASLVANLGFDAALEAATRNGWEGVLQILAAQQRPYRGRE